MYHISFRSRLGREVDPWNEIWLRSPVHTVQKKSGFEMCVCGGLQHQSGYHLRDSVGGAGEVT